jgi:hypothetical protein
VSGHIVPGVRPTRVSKPLPPSSVVQQSQTDADNQSDDSRHDAASTAQSSLLPFFPQPTNALNATASREA